MVLRVIIEAAGKQVSQFKVCKGQEHVQGVKQLTTARNLATLNLATPENFATLKP